MIRNNRPETVIEQVLSRKETSFAQLKPQTQITIISDLVKVKLSKVTIRGVTVEWGAEIDILEFLARNKGLIALKLEDCPGLQFFVTKQFLGF